MGDYPGLDPKWDHSHPYERQRFHTHRRHVQRGRDWSHVVTTKVSGTNRCWKTQEMDPLEAQVGVRLH